MSPIITSEVSSKKTLQLDEFSIHLKTHLQREGISLFPSDVECWFSKETIVILLHYPDLTGSDLSLIFNQLKEIIEKETTLSAYPVSIYLVDDQQKAILEELKFNQPIAEQSQNYIQLLTVKRSSYIWLGTAALGITSALIYSLTHPCLIGECAILSNTKQFEQKSLTITQSTVDLSNLTKYKERLSALVEQLKTIPPWSRSYQQAKAEINKYEIQLNSLDIFIQATILADNAFNQSKKLPLSTVQWEKINEQWTTAISLLETISPQQPLEKLSQSKLKSYRLNLSNSQARLQKENQAIIYLNLAKNAAKLAKIRQDAAQFAAEWQLVEATWQTVLKNLNNIALGTTVYAEAKQLTDTYMSQMVRATSKKNQEQFAKNLYEKALNEAKVAQEMEQKNQWIQASQSWRNAITYLEQITKNTFEDTQAKPLISNYLVSLNNAEQKAKNTVKISQFKKELDELCSQNDQICSYKINSDSVKVYFKHDYTQKIRDLAIESKAEGNIQKQTQLLDHITHLEERLQIFSTQMKRKLEVYNQEGKLLTSYEP